jgi:GTP-binding protein Era
MDTPGIHKAQDEFNRGLVDTALSALGEADVVLFMIEPEGAYGQTNDFIARRLARIHTPVLLVINKVDTLRNKSDLLPLIQNYQARLDFKAVIPVSALKGEQTTDILGEIVALLPEGPQYYPGDYITDQPERFFVGELIREKIFHLVHQEIPYAVAVTVDKFSEIADKNLIEIYATVNVERESQKAIIIGKGGQMLKEIGKEARLEIETFLGCHIYLGLFVRVQKNWRKDPRAMHEFGYR